MNRLKKILRGLRRTFKFSVSDPKSFNEVWSFTSNPLRVISLFIVLLILTTWGTTYLINSGNSYFSTNDVSIERDELEEQNERILSLTDQLTAQENYINKIKLILSGEVPVDTPLDSIDIDINAINMDSLNTKETKSEQELAKKVKEDMLTNLQSNNPMTYFGAPVKGVVSQKFNKKTHPGIDIVTEKDNAVKACLSGTVIYAGYTRKDGHIIIVDHANKYISVYKHNKRILKKAGAKVNLGDPIAIVGNTGENSDGPHLHFELWYDQMPVNPADYIEFSR